MSQSPFPYKYTGEIWPCGEEAQRLMSELQDYYDYYCCCYYLYKLILTDMNIFRNLGEESTFVTQSINFESKN